MKKTLIMTLTIALNISAVYASEYHVATDGADNNPGTEQKPLRNIQTAATLAHPGDTITVHEGVYRERINPPRGGTSDEQRITYRAAAGDKVAIKGSEVVKGWQKVENDTWKVNLPNSFFGDHNPYKIKVHGDWFRARGGKGRVYHTGEVYLDGHWLTEAARVEDVLKPAAKKPLWFSTQDASGAETNTTIWAQFPDVNPNESEVEINVREAVFYPAKTGINYITVRRFTMEQAAPNWAPPTAEQVGLIGTHWSKGWIIEDNTIRYAKCTGITLGKYGDEWDNRAQSAKGYVGTINRALENGWSKANIGSHIVRNNRISHCEQAGMVGSMGAIFSTVTGNTIHDINTRGIFGGAEMAGIKFHGPIDTIISHNHIYRCGGSGGIWLDWMTQGTRVTGNLLHDNRRHDLFVEVNHGPFLIDNNLFLSGKSINDWSQGAAYVHNLIAGRIQTQKEGRKTPYFKPHTTGEMKLSDIKHKDARYYNNLLAGNARLPGNGNPENLQIAGNERLKGIDLELEAQTDELWLNISLLPPAKKGEIVTTESLGKAKIPDAPFVAPDGTPYRLDRDYFGKKRNAANPAAGPFALQGDEKIHLQVWPKGE